MLTCYKPLRIKNQYTGDWLHVPCRSCDACLISQANLKAYNLSTTLARYKYNYLITLTYDNDSCPYIIQGYNYIFRGQGIDDFPDVLDWIPEMINWDDEFKYLTNHADNRAIGVLYYRDVQLFLKRFRKYILKHYGNKKWSYFVVGEYGTFYGRPHYHICVFSDDLLFEECQNAAFENWSYHNWHRFWKNGVNEACKRCSKDCAAYISSYVNCNCNKLSISRYKCFSQKTARSKGINFGLDAKILEVFKQDVRRFFKNMVFDGSREVFTYLDNTKVDNVSFRIIPQRYLSTCFHKFKSWNKLSLVSKFSCARCIVEKCEYLKSNHLSLDTPLNGFSLSSLDLSFYRSYKRFCRTFLTFKDGDYYFDSDEFGLFDYVVLMDRILTRYYFYLLREQMKMSEVMGNDEYYLSLIDTKCEFSKGTRVGYLFRHLSGNFKKQISSTYDFDCTPYHRNELDAMCKKYRKRLLPKHLNDKDGIMINV